MLKSILEQRLISRDRRQTMITGTIYNAGKMLEMTQKWEQKKSSGNILKKEVKVEIDEQIKTNTYSLTDIESDYYAWNVRVSNGSYYFDYHTPGKVYYDMQMTYPGIHNIENAVLALSIALSLGVNAYELRSALKSFKVLKVLLNSLFILNAFPCTHVIHSSLQNLHLVLSHRPGGFSPHRRNPYWSSL